MTESMGPAPDAELIDAEAVPFTDDERRWRSRRAELIRAIGLDEP